MDTKLVKEEKQVEAVTEKGVSTGERICPGLEGQEELEDCVGVRGRALRRQW